MCACKLTSPKIEHAGSSTEKAPLLSCCLPTSIHVFKSPMRVKHNDQHLPTPDVVPAVASFAAANRAPAAPSSNPVLVASAAACSIAASAAASASNPAPVAAASAAGAAAAAAADAAACSSAGPDSEAFAAAAVVPVPQCGPCSTCKAGLLL